MRPRGNDPELMLPGLVKAAVLALGHCYSGPAPQEGLNTDISTKISGFHLKRLTESATEFLRVFLVRDCSHEPRFDILLIILL